MAEPLVFSSQEEENLADMSQYLYDYVPESYKAYKKIYDTAKTEEKSIKERRGEALKKLLANPRLRSSLKQYTPELYIEGLRAERGPDWKMTLDDIAKALGKTKKEILSPEEGWLSGKNYDFQYELGREGLDWKEALNILRDAQTQADREKLWKDEPWYNRAAMTAFAPLTSEDLSKGKPVDDIYTADYVGFGANVVPASRFIKALGPIGRTTVDIALPSVAEGVTSVVADDVPVEEAFKNTSKNLAAGGVATGALKSGAKGIGFIRGAIDKSGKQAANVTEDALKEGFYRSDLEKRVAKIGEMIKKGQRPSESDLELYQSFNMLKDMGVDLSNLGKFSESKLKAYLDNLKKDPLKYTDKARAAGKLKEGEDLFARREAIKGDLDPVEQFKFENNPGKVTFTDLAAESDKVGTYGWAPKAGFGKARGKIERSSLEGHEGITGAERPSFASHIEAGKKAGLAHTDPYYPRNLDVNKAAEELMLKYPQLKLYFSKMYNDPTRRDYLLNQVIPNLYWRLQVNQRTEPEKKEDKE